MKLGQFLSFFAIQDEFLMSNSSQTLRQASIFSSRFPQLCNINCYLPRVAKKTPGSSLQLSNNKRIQRTLSKACINPPLVSSNRIFFWEGEHKSNTTQLPLCIHSEALNPQLLIKMPCSLAQINIACLLCPCTAPLTHDSRSRVGS